MEKCKHTQRHKNACTRGRGGEGAKLVWIKWIQKEIVPELENSAAKKISKKRQKNDLAEEVKKCIQDERHERVQQHSNTIGPTKAFDGMCLYLPDKGGCRVASERRAVAEARYNPPVDSKEMQSAQWKRGGWGQKSMFFFAPIM